MANAPSHPAKSGGIVQGPKFGPGGGVTKGSVDAWRPVIPTSATSGPGSGPGSGSPGPPGGGAGAGTGAGPSSGPGSGVSGGTGSGGPSGSPGTNGSVSAGSNGSASNGSSGGYYVDPNFNSAIADSFISILQNATSPDALNAQNIILRRIALEGDIIGGRIAPPDTVTAIGGYLNYLTNVNQLDMRAQMLAGILGVAGPNPPLGWLSASAPPLTFVKIPNDRPVGAAQSTIPLSIAVRSDFADALKAAVTALHNQGCMLPLQSGPVSLPQGSPGASAPADPLPYLGRALDVVAATALVDPTTDPIALVRASGTGNAFEIAARVLSPGSVAVTPANYDAVQCTQNACTIVSLTAAPLVTVAGALQSAGFYETSPMPMPSSVSSASWAHLTNVTGLVKGVTKLGDELSLLYSWSDIQNSAFAGSLALVWDGTTFSAS